MRERNQREPLLRESKQEQPYDPARYFKRAPDNTLVAEADFAMRGYFVTAMIFGALHEGEGVFADHYFNMVWNFVDGFGSFPGIRANWNNKGKRENALLVFETTVANFLIFSNVVSIIAQKQPEWFGVHHEWVASLSGYGFALSMTASALRALSDFYDALEKGDKKKAVAALVNFFGYLAAAVCFWLLALTPYTGLSFVGGSYFPLIISGSIKAAQLLVSGGMSVADWIEDWRGTFIQKHTHIINEEGSPKIKPARKKDSESDDESEELGRVVNNVVKRECTDFLGSLSGISNVEKAKYRIALYLHLQHKQSAQQDERHAAPVVANSDELDISGKSESEQFLENLYLTSSTKRQAIFKAATDEFILLMKSVADKKSSLSDKQLAKETLELLCGDNATYKAAYNSAYDAVGLSIEDTNTEVREKQARSAVRFFDKRGAVGSAGEASNGLAPVALESYQRM